MRVAYLSSKQSLPGEESREIDLIEHQQMMSVLRPVFAANNYTIEDIAWDDKNSEWNRFDAAIVGSTWDYCDRCNEFLDTLTSINETTPVFNPPELIAWNVHKSYLKDLANKGVKIVPTVWVDEPKKPPIWHEIFNAYGTDTLVVKKQVGANAEGQFLLNRGEPAPTLTDAMMVQPFIDSIVTEGEYSLIFIGGELSHALIKRPKSGDYRIQKTYGGREEAVSLSKEDVEPALMALRCLDTQPLYARVDLVRGKNRSLLLMELELIEPFLYPIQSQRLGELFLRTVQTELS